MRIASGDRSLPRKLAFTVERLNAAKCPAGKDRVYIYDARTPGLALMVTAGGAKAFYIYRKVNGQPQRFRIGGFPAVSIEQARKVATMTAGKIAAGGDPMEERRQARARGMTIDKLWKWYLENHAKPRKRSWEDDQQRYETHIKPALEHRPIEKVTRPDVVALHHKVAAARTQATANRVLALLSVMYSKARMIGYEGGNPCQGVERFRETSRERFLTAEELPRFFNAINDEETPPLWRDFFQVLLYTGARSGNVKAMRWDELDLQAGIWRIPAGKAKAGEALAVHLPADALAILQERKKRARGQWVFPGRNHSGHVTQPQATWIAVTKRAGLQDLHMHDLRRTLGSWQAATGASLHVIGKSLGHRAVQTTAIYARLQLDPVRESVNKATEAMKAAVAAARKSHEKA
jgi:integrase